MHEELIRVHNDQDRLEERLSAVESQQLALVQAARPAEPERLEHSRLKVVRLVPDDQASPADAPVTSQAPAAAGAEGAAPGTPRPMIKGTGDKVYTTADEPAPKTAKGSK